MSRYLNGHLTWHTIFLDHLILHLELHFLALRCGDCLPCWVAQPRPLFIHYAADCGKNPVLSAAVCQVTLLTSQPPRLVLADNLNSSHFWPKTGLFQSSFRTTIWILDHLTTGHKSFHLNTGPFDNRTQIVPFEYRTRTIFLFVFQVEHLTVNEAWNGRQCSMFLYLPCRTAQVLARY